MTGFLSAILVAVLSVSFHQEDPENTIRILIEKPLDSKHPRIMPLIEESHYRLNPVDEDGFQLHPPDPSHPILDFKVVRDENTRALIFLKHDADVLYDNLSIAKTEWMRNKMDAHHLRIIASPGESVSQLALNGDRAPLNDPAFQSRIAKALPTLDWSKTVFQNWVEPLNPSPILQESRPLEGSARTRLDYLATATREGQQIAYLTREALGKVGIDVRIQIYEPALFYTKIRKREFDLYSSTSVPGMKNILDLPHTTLIPLFRWKHGLILNPRIKTDSELISSMDYSFRFLTHLQLQ
jgi:hypothetical protein